MKKVIYFSFCHPEINPGGAQHIAKALHDSHSKKYGLGSSLFIAATLGESIARPPGSNLLQVAPHELLYICPAFDYMYYTNYDVTGQAELIEVIQSFAPDTLHFHHFMGFGLDLIQAILSKCQAKSIFTLHEHLVICQNNGHLIQSGNSRVCDRNHAARCSVCLPSFRYDYFNHRNRIFETFLNAFDCVTSVSDFTRRAVESTLQLDGEITVVSNGPISADRPWPTLELDSIRLAYIGQIHKAKGVHILLSALEIVNRTDPLSASWLSLDIWGSYVDKDYEVEISDQVDTLLSLGFDISVNGTYYNGNLASILYPNNVVVVPSLWPESYCLTADEAVNNEKILICTDFPALNERFSINDGVRIVPMNSSWAIANEILKLREARVIKLSDPFIYRMDSFDTVHSQYETFY